jgi:hypothetical protein
VAEEKKDNSGDKLAVIAVIGIVFVILAIPVILAYLILILVRNYLTRKEMWFLTAVGALAVVLTTLTSGGQYLSWMWNAAQRDFDFATFPYLLVIAWTTLFVGIAGLSSSTRIAERIPWLGKGVGKPERESILPSDKDRKKVTSIVAAPGSQKSPGSTSLVVNSTPGNRSFPIGASRSGAPVMLSESQIRLHGMILGATGSGKTESIKVLAGGLLDLGWSGMILDLKEDVAPGGLREWCYDYSVHHNVPYQELRLSDSESRTWFNPLSGMGPDEIRDTILALQEFDDAYWQALNKELLGQVVNLLVWAHQVDPGQFPYPSMYDIGKLLASGDVRSATKKPRAIVVSSVPGVTEDDFRALANPSTAMQQSATGYGSKLTQFYDTQAGRTVLRPGLNNERTAIDVTLPGMTYVGLDSQGKSDLTKVISSAMLQRMSVYAAQRITGNQPTTGPLQPRFLIVDEANWVNRKIVQNLLSRARSAGIAMVLCTQGPKDWIDEQGDDWGKLTQNVNIAIIMSQGEPESAILCADYIGQKYQKQHSEMVKESRGLLFNKSSRNTDGEIVESFSVREELAHIVDPDDLRRMGVGEAIIRVGKPNEIIEWVKLPMRNPKS